jgi:predicted lysophospholipase L1 biosynthesis ABC-type transport system permease subunit
MEFDKLDDGPAPIRHRIVGVVANSRWNNLREAEEPTLYPPLHDPSRSTLIVRRLSGGAWMRREIEAAAPALTVRGSTSLLAQLDHLTIREQLLAALAAFFSAAALLLAGVGLYGVIHFAAVQRTREIGIRIALGARRGSVVRLMLREMSAPVLAGIVAGMAAGPALARYLASQLFGVRPTDLWSFAGPALCILLAAVVATLPPAIRASAADPITALRQE